MSSVAKANATKNQMIERILAHAIVYEGVEYPLHIAELTDSGTIKLYPFEHELHSTRFIPGRVTVSVGSDGHLVVKPIAKP